jgi:hypothetical protein
VIGSFLGDWWDAAMVYRAWVLPSAEWTQAGPLRNRADMPEWLVNLPVWVNSGWQELDIFNKTQGDPAVVQQRVSAISKRYYCAAEALHSFDSAWLVPILLCFFAAVPRFGGGALGLHWYEWDTIAFGEISVLSTFELHSVLVKYLPASVSAGSSDACVHVLSLTDTHYPEYFPVSSAFSQLLPVCCWLLTGLLCLAAGQGRLRRHCQVPAIDWRPHRSVHQRWVLKMSSSVPLFSYLRFHCHC